jgi:hypothetical protein
MANNITIRSTVSQFLLRTLYRLKLLFEWGLFSLWTTEISRLRLWPTLSGVDNYHWGVTMVWDPRRRAN